MSKMKSKFGAKRGNKLFFFKKKKTHYLIIYVPAQSPRMCFSSLAQSSDH